MSLQFWYFLLYLNYFTANYLDHHQFQDFVKNILNKHQCSIMKKCNLSIGIDHRFADILTRSKLASGIIMINKLSMADKEKLHRLLRKALIKNKKKDRSWSLKGWKMMQNMFLILNTKLNSLKSSLRIRRLNWKRH